MSWFFADTNQTYTLQEIAGRVDECALKLFSYGLQPQSRVGLVLNNGIELVVYLLACWRLNLVAVPLRTKSGKYLNYSDFLARCNISCLFGLILCDGSVSKEDIAHWRGQTDLNIYSESDFFPVQTDPFPGYPECHPDDIAIIQFSSGSTGYPKGVIVTHRMVINQLSHIEQAHSLSRNRSPLQCSASWTPIHHDMGLFTGVLLPVYSGSNHLLATPDYFMRNPARWFCLLSKYQVDLSFITNSALVAALRTVKRLYNENVDLSRLHLYISAEKISPRVLENFRYQFAPLSLQTDHIHSAYGMAENSLGACCTGLEEVKILSITVSPEGKVTPCATGDATLKVVSCGKANRYHIITVRDEGDNPVGELQLGEINIESDCLTPGYLNMPEATESRLKGGRLRTGDLGFIYQQEIYFYSRKDDLIIVGGRNIIPDDVEESIESLSFVRPSSSALLAIENASSGITELHLLVEGNANDSKKERVEKLKAMMAIVFDIHDLILNHIYICGRGSIEKTSSGKKRRNVICQRLINNVLSIFT